MLHAANTASQELHSLIGIDVDPSAHVIAADKLQSIKYSDLKIHHLLGNFG